MKLIRKYWGSDGRLYGEYDNGKTYALLETAPSNASWVAANPKPGTSSPASSPPTITAKQKREQERAQFTGWSNIPEVRILQQQSWQMYVDTGSWDTPEQKAWNEQANKIRAAVNPAHDPTKMPSGPSNPYEAGMIALPTNISGLGGIVDAGKGLVSSGGVILLAAAALLILRR